MPTEIGIDYSEEVCRAFEEEISYEQHIENMDRIRGERRDRIYPAPPRDRRVSNPNEGERTALNYSTDDWGFTDPEVDRVVVPKKNLIGGELL